MCNAESGKVRGVPAGKLLMSVVEERKEATSSASSTVKKYISIVSSIYLGFIVRAALGN